MEILSRTVEVNKVLNIDFCSEVATGQKERRHQKPVDQEEEALVLLQRLVMTS